MNLPSKTTWWQRQHVNTSILLLVLALAFSTFIATEMIGVAYYGESGNEAVFNVLMLVAVASLGVFGGLAYRRRRYSVAVLGLGAMLTLDFGTWMVLPFRERPVLPISVTTYLFIGVVSVGTWWLSSRTDRDE